MKKLVYFLFVAFITISCTKKSVKLPVNNILGIQDTIYDNSQIWWFFKEDNQDTIAFLNRNNKLANTHYIFNIDKRLKLKHIIEDLNAIQFKKEQPSMHSNNQYMHSYLSYVNSETAKLSMVLFDSVKFFPLTELKVTKNQLLLNYSTSSLQLNRKNIALENLQAHLKKYQDSTKRKLHLILNKNVSYDNYIKLKANLQQLKLDSVGIDWHEYLD